MRRSSMETAADGLTHAAHAVRHDWTRDEMRALFALPFPELMFRAQSVHRTHFDPARGTDLHAALDQDRRLSGGLRLLSAERAVCTPA